MTATDLKPGDIVQHPEKGRGIIDRTLAQQLGVYYMRDGGSFAWTSDFTGWERVETVRPGHVQVRVDDLHLGTTAGRVSAIDRLYEAFTPPQPDEPTEFGARVTVTLPDGTREKWLRSKVGTNKAWGAENGSEIGWFIATTWDNVIERGTVTLGWDE